MSKYTDIEISELAVTLENTPDADVAPVKRVNLNIPEVAYKDAVAAARRRGWSLTQFVLFAIGLAVRVLKETAQGGRLIIRTNEGERELLLLEY